jgi:cytochrome c oxidase cbb3-type subunit III
MLKHATQTAMLVLILFLSSRASLAQTSGEDLFKQKCVVCHGPDGLGNNPMGKALGIVSYKSPDVLKMKDAELADIIKNGKNNKMPAFNAQLTDAQIKDVLKYVHTLQK